MKIFFASLVAVAIACAQDVSIRNETFDVRLSASTFSITEHGVTVVREGTLRDRGSARVVSSTDKIFGTGQALEVAYRNGDTDSILLFPQLPFVLFRSTIRNSSTETSTTEKVNPLRFAVDFDPQKSKVLGTGGLADPGKAPGSYMWTAIAETETRKGIVAGWLTSDRGSGVVFSELKNGKIFVQSQIDYGKLHIKPGQAETLETFAVGYFDDARFGLEAWADAVAKVYRVRLKPQPVGYCTWYHAHASSEKELPEQTAFAAQNLKPFGFSFIQIDDGWQDGLKANGPMKNFTQVKTTGPYPSGMKHTADDISAHGLTPGIWFMPFAGNFEDPWFKDRQDWFAHRADGKPYDVRWGGTSLDMTNPAAREYVRDLVHRIAEWGYRYFKMDGLWTGSATEMEYVNDAYKDDQIGNAVLHDPDKTNIEMYRDGLKLVRDAAGPGVFFLGCNTPQNMRVYGGSFGLLDAMRIGPDNGTGWDALIRGPKYGTRNYFLNGRVWYNDPDPLYVRASLPLNQARLISSWVTISGQLSVSSEDFGSLPPDRVDLLKRTMPSHGLPARPADLFERDLPRIWTVNGPDSRVVVGLFNWEQQDREIDYPVERLGLKPGVDYAAFEYWSNKIIEPVRDRLHFKLPASSSAVLAIRAVSNHPQVVSTSRHITQGLIDLSNEQWRAGELSGVSKVVAGDPYELRIAPGAWLPDDADNGPLLRIKVDSSVGGEVHWKVKFHPR
jgi:Melibiase